MNFTLIIRSGIMILLFCGFSIIQGQLPGVPAMPLKEMKNVFGGTGSDRAFSVIATADSGYLMAGYTESDDGDVSGNHGNIDVWVVKLNKQWEIQWQKTLGGSLEDRAHSVVQTTDGGYAVVGYSGSNDGDATVNHGSLDVWIVKLNSTGALQWQKSFGGTGIDIGNSIIQTLDGGYAVAGLSNSNDGDVSGNHGDQDFWVIKLNSTGILEWQKALGGTLDDGSTSLLQAQDGGYVVSGISKSNDGDVSGNHGQEDIWVLKLNSTGSQEWQKTFGGTGNDEAYCLIKTNDNQYAIAGMSDSNDGDVSGNHGLKDYWVIKINTAGTTLEWQKTIGGNSDEQAHSLIQMTDGNYIVAGFSVSETGDISGPSHGMEDALISKLDANGNIVRIFSDTAQ